MKYALISNDLVMEVIEPHILEDGSEVPIEERFTPEFITTLVNVTDEDPMPAFNWKAVKDNKDKFIFIEE